MTRKQFAIWWVSVASVTTFGMALATAIATKAGGLW